MKRAPGLIIVLYGIAIADRPLITILMTNDVWFRYICSPTISDLVRIRTRVATALERARHHCATRPSIRCYLHHRGKAGRYVLFDGPVYLRWKVMAIYAPRTERAVWRHGWELHELPSRTNAVRPRTSALLTWPFNDMLDSEADFSMYLWVSVITMYTVQLTEQPVDVDKVVLAPKPEPNTSRIVADF